MLFVVTMNLGVAVEAYRDCVLDIVEATNRLWVNMVGFDFNPAKTVANATPSPTAGQKLRYTIPIEAHLFKLTCDQGLSQRTFAVSARFSDAESRHGRDPAREASWRQPVDISVFVTSKSV